MTACNTSFTPAATDRTAAYTTAHSVDTAWGLALELALRIMRREGIEFGDALVRLADELPHCRFHGNADELEEYTEEELVSFDVLPGTRYNTPVEFDGREYKLPSATAAVLFRERWAICPRPNVIEVILEDYGERFKRALEGALLCLAVNNGYGRSEFGGYLKYRFEWSFAGLARLASFFEDGRDEGERFAHWHRKLVEVARVGYLALAQGVSFPKQIPYDRRQAREGGLVSYLELFRKAHPVIAGELAIGKGTLSRYECLFTLPGYLVALFAVGDGDRVEAEYAAWREAFALGERVLERRRELATELVVGFERDRNYFGLDHVRGAVGLYVETDEHVGRELWGFLKSTADSKEWSSLQETFHELLAAYLPDELGGRRLDKKAKTEHATMATLRMSSEPKAVMGFVERYVDDELIRESLVRLVALHNLRPAVMVMRKSTGHYVVLTNASLGVKVDLRKVHSYLERVEPGTWHVEGHEVTGRFRNHMLMTQSSKVRDRAPSALTPAQVKKVLRLLVGVIS